MKKIIFIFLISALFTSVNAQSTGSTGYWDLRGNAGTNPRYNFIGTTDANPLIFKTGDLERMRLLSNQTFLGIGTDDPLATLHLHYQLPLVIIPTYLELLQLTTYNSPNGFSISSHKTTSDLYFRQQESAKFFLEGPGGGMVIAQDGKIGVGTDAPQQKVHVVGTIKATNADIAGTVSADALNAQSATIAGIDLVAQNEMLLKKMEELTLYLIQMEKRFLELENKKGVKK